MGRHSVHAGTRRWRYSAFPLLLTLATVVALARLSYVVVTGTPVSGMSEKTIALRKIASIIQTEEHQAEQLAEKGEATFDPATRTEFLEGIVFGFGPVADRVGSAKRPAAASVDDMREFLDGHLYPAMTRFDARIFADFQDVMSSGDHVAIDHMLDYTARLMLRAYGTVTGRPLSSDLASMASGEESIFLVIGPVILVVALAIAGAVVDVVVLQGLLVDGARPLYDEVAPNVPPVAKTATRRASATASAVKSGFCQRRIEGMDVQKPRAAEASPVCDERYVLEVEADLERERSLARDRLVDQIATSLRDYVLPAG